MDVDPNQPPRHVHVRVRQPRYTEIRRLADAESRSTSNMVDVLLGEALAARRKREGK